MARKDRVRRKYGLKKFLMRKDLPPMRLSLRSAAQMSMFIMHISRAVAKAIKDPDLKRDSHPPIDMKAHDADYMIYLRWQSPSPACAKCGAAPPEQLPLAMRQNEASAWYWECLNPECGVRNYVTFAEVYITVQAYGILELSHIITGYPQSVARERDPLEEAIVKVWQLVSTYFEKQMSSIDATREQIGG